MILFFLLLKIHKIFQILSLYEFVNTQAHKSLLKGMYLNIKKKKKERNTI